MLIERLQSEINFELSFSHCFSEDTIFDIHGMRHKYRMLKLQIGQIWTMSKSDLSGALA